MLLEHPNTRFFYSLRVKNQDIPYDFLVKIDYFWQFWACLVHSWAHRGKKTSENMFKNFFKHSKNTILSSFFIRKQAMFDDFYVKYFNKNRNFWAVLEMKQGKRQNRISRFWACLTCFLASVCSTVYQTCSKL